MRAMILAAGRGERMGALTQHTPKPLLQTGGKFLIEYSIAALQRIGVTDIVINVCYYADQIMQRLGNGSQYGVNLFYSEESEALETGGGIFKALPLLGNDPFIVLSADVVTDFPLQQLPKEPQGLAHLVLVDNPAYHLGGDFCLVGDRVCLGGENTFTFGNIGVYRPELFADCQPGKFRLGKLLQQEIAKQNISGEYYRGRWFNVGTPEDLEMFKRNPIVIAG